MFLSEATRTTLVRSSITNATKRKSSIYVCPACQHARSRNLHSTTISSVRPARNLQDPTLTSRLAGPPSIRQFSQSRNRLQATEHVAQDLNNDVPHYSFSIKRPQPASQPKTDIRDSLKLWSKQNETLKEQTAPADVPAEGRITQLPNAIFLKSGSEEIEEDTDLSKNIDIFGDDDAAESITFEPGTLFSHEGARARQYAVYLGTVGVQAQLALQSGQWSLERLPAARNADSSARRAVIPNFLTAQEVERLRACVPNEAIERTSPNGNEKNDVSMQGLIQGPQAEEILRVFLGKMRSFVIDVEEFDRKYGADIDAAYDKVAHDSEWRFVTLRDYAQAAGHDYDSMSDAARMAFLNRVNEVDHLCCDSAASSVVILCCSKDLKKRMMDVVEWARKYQDAAVQAAVGKDVASLLRENPLTSFIDKSRRLILKSRKIRAPTTIGCLGPTSGDRETLRKAPTEEEFTATDKSIIDFVWNAVFRKPRPLANGSWRMLPVTSLILRAVGAYPSLTLSPKVGRLFLKEIGCADPWAGKNSCDLSLPLPAGRASHRTDILSTELKDVARKFGGTVAARGILPGMDTMAHLRKDWGSLPAFAIDPENAEVLEDAISVEPAKDVPGGYWVHVHVSHVTAFFDAKSVVERSARNQGAACFVVDGSLPVGMVPRAISDVLSLQADAPVITVSTLITEDGRVLDNNVSVGYIRNFHRVNRQAVEHVLGAEEDEDKWSVLVVGKVPYVKRQPLKQAHLQKAVEHKETFELLQKLFNARLERRREEMPIPMRFETLDYGSGVSTTLLRYLPGSEREHKSYHWKGDPGIILTGKRKIESMATDQKRNRDIVTQAMRLAAESAGNWLAQRNIPVVYLGTKASPGNPISKLTQGFNNRQTLAPLFHRSSTPAIYWNINIKAYTLCTSPLRRYMDMVATFQMDAYLKAEASGAVQPGAPIKDHSLLAFSKSEIDDYINGDAGAADAIDITTRQGKLSYAFQALFRAFHFKESKLPEVWEVVIQEPFKVSATGKEIYANGKLIPFGLDVKVKSSPEGWDKMAGYQEFLPVKIELVDPDELVVFVNAIGPPSRTQMMMDPIQAWSEANIIDSQETGDTKLTFVRKL